MSRPPVWPSIDSRRLVGTRIFDVRADRKRHPVDGSTWEFYVLDPPDWVNVIPLTPAGEVVLVEQHRHGIDAPTLEIPGGMVDPTDASAAAAAERELLEETGYRGEPAIELGCVHPNPAIQTNRCSTFLVRDAIPVQAPQPDGGEDLRIELQPLDAVPGLLRDGRITHALVVAAFQWLRLWETA